MNPPAKIKPEHQKHVFQQVMEQSESISVQGYNEKHEVIYWNNASELIYGYTKEEAMGKTLESLIIPIKMRKFVKDGVDNWIKNSVAIPSSELILIDKYGNDVNVFSQHVMIKGEDKSYEMYCLDINLKEIKKAQKEIDFFTQYDTLTGLSNKTILMDRLIKLFKSDDLEQTHHALLFIDLDKFKEINDTMGHSVGDKILVLVASRLKKIIRKNDTLARLGGDEFSIILEDINKSIYASDIAQKILNTLKEPFVIDNNKFYITSSIGIAIFPDDAHDADSLLKYADSAMYKAKENGRDSFFFYTTELSLQVIEKIAIVNDLRDALKNREFELYYQAQTNAKTKKTVAAEALIRWNHPNKGLISPFKFIDIAETSGQIIEIGKWVIYQGMQDISQWKKQGLDIEKISINLSVKQLNDAHLLEMIQDTLLETHCKSEWIEFEITESYAMNDPKSAIELLNKIVDLGFSLSIDDFGTGYSSLSYLKKLPISKLKIDKSFVDDVPSMNEDNEIVVKTIILLAQGMKLEVIAEGVETQKQQEFLLKNACFFSQGYLYSKPISKRDFEVYISI